jgi:hypothetical protein
MNLAGGSDGLAQLSAFGSINRLRHGFTGCGKTQTFGESGDTNSAGAKARIDFEAVSARLKSCPVTKRETKRVFRSL